MGASVGVEELARVIFENSANGEPCKYAECSCSMNWGNKSITDQLPFRLAASAVLERYNVTAA